MTQFDPTLLERGLVCSPGALVTVDAAVVAVRKIAYYKGAVSTKSKFHITLGHETVMGKLSVFASVDDTQSNQTDSSDSVAGDLQRLKLSSARFDFSKEYAYREELLRQGETSNSNAEQDGSSSSQIEEFFALIELDHPVTCASDALVIGSRLDVDVHTSSCRIAFYGKIVEAIADSNFKTTVLPRIKVFKVSTEIL